MLVKLHGGPSHGKVVQVRDGWYETFVNSVKADKNFFVAMWDDNPAAQAPFNVKTHRYAVKRFPNPFDPSGYIPCLTPKGEVIFFHDKDY